MTKYVPTMTVDQVYKKMSSLGIKTSPSKIRAMIDAGQYPWAVSCQMKERTYEIYEVLFKKWIAERIVAVNEDDLFDWD